MSASRGSRPAPPSSRQTGRVLALPGDPGAGMFVLREGTVDVELGRACFGSAPATSSGSSRCSSTTVPGSRASVRRHASAASRSARRLPGARRDGAELRPPHAPRARPASGRGARRGIAEPARPRRTCNHCRVRDEAHHRQPPMRDDYHLLDGSRPASSCRDRGEVAPRRRRAARAGVRRDPRRGGVARRRVDLRVRGSNLANHRPERDRKLLLHRREIDSLYGKVREKGLTLVPTRLYFKEGRVKVEIAVARGKERIDKRRDLAERDAKRRDGARPQGASLTGSPSSTCRIARTAHATSGSWCRSIPRPRRAPTWPIARPPEPARPSA